MARRAEGWETDRRAEIGCRGHHDIVRDPFRDCSGMVGFLSRRHPRRIDRDQPAPQRRPHRHSQAAERTWRSLWPRIHQRPPVQRARRTADRHHRSGQAAGHSDRRLRQAGRLERPVRVRQHLPDPQHRPHPPRYVGGINTIAAIEAVPTTRLSEIWLEQKFANDKASIRAASSRPTPSFSTANSARCFCRATGRPSRRSICRAAAPPTRYRPPARASKSSRSTT